MRRWSAMALALPLLFGAGDELSAQQAELGGVVVEQRSGKPFLSPVPASVNLYSDLACVASAPVGLDGQYTLRAPPGRYWAQVLVGNEEALAEEVELGPGSWRHDFHVPAPVEPAPVWVALGGRWGLRR